jgi:DNA-binding transcriptional regulator YhcF (GntR family)
MDSLFFRVEHDLLRSESFQSLGGSAIKVYLVIGLYADFGTGWAYPSIRTIARQAGLSRQTVLDAIGDLSRVGLLATSKSQGKSTAYKIIRQAPERPTPGKKARPVQISDQSVPETLEVGPETVRISLEDESRAVPKSFEALAQFFGPPGPEARPEREQGTREDSPSIPIPGTPFRISAEGRLSVAVDLQGLLTDQGIPRRLAEKLAAQKDPESVAKVLLNALYLQSQGKLQNGPGYIRAGIEDGYDLLPQVANRLESRRKELEEQIRSVTSRREQVRRQASRAAEEAAVESVLGSLEPDELQELISRAVASLPGPMVRRNPTLSNPFVRGKVYELAGGEPIS